MIKCAILLKLNQITLVDGCPSPMIERSYQTGQRVTKAFKKDSIIKICNKTDYYYFAVNFKVRLILLSRILKFFKNVDTNLFDKIGFRPICPSTVV